LNGRGADELLSSGWKPGEKVLEWRGTGETLFALEIDPAPGVVGIGVAFDVREIEPKLEGVLSFQVRDIVLKIVKRVGGGLQRTAAPATELSLAKTRNDDGGKPPRARDPGIDGITCAIGQHAGVVGEKEEAEPVVADSKIVNQVGARRPNPVAGGRPRGFQNRVPPSRIHHREIFSGAAV